MKKILLLLTIIFAVAKIDAQSLTAVNAVNNLSSAVTTSILQGTVDINNVSTSPIDVMVERTTNNLSAGHGSYFCWGINCYGEGTSISDDSVHILPGATETSFYADLDPHNNAGYSTVCYNFFDMFNVTDAVLVCFTYDIATGIQVPGASVTNPLSAPSPNPANNLTSINYNSAGDNARIVVYNLLGSSVKEIKLNGKQGTLVLVTSDLKQGVYYYSLVSAEKIIATNKLVIAHK